MAECNCVMKRSEKGADDMSVCNAESDDGNLCGLPDGHDGEHVACSVASHPVESWPAE